MIPLQEDGFDDIRLEFSEMLQQQAVKGTKGIVKSKYVVFGIESASLKEARSKLQTIEIDIVKNLKRIGATARVLNGTERMRVFHDFFHQDTMEELPVSFSELVRSGSSVKDVIAPSGFDFRSATRFQMGELFGKVFYLDMIAPQFTDELVKEVIYLSPETVKLKAAIAMKKAEMANYYQKFILLKM